MAWPTSSAVPGWALWALTITGQPAANAEAVSPPATENANGKLLAPNTATGPRGIWRCRMSARGRGARSGMAGSMRTPRKSPWRTTSANSRSWPTVRARSPRSRSRPRPVSVEARSMSSSPMASMFSAMASRNRACCSGSRVLKDSKASAAAAVAALQLVLADQGVGGFQLLVGGRVDPVGGAAGSGGGVPRRSGNVR